MILALILPISCYAETAATPATIQAQIAGARCGDTIRLVGTFTAKIAVKTRPSCPVTLDLTSATATQFTFVGASNWIVSGGTFTGAPFVAMQVINSDHLSFLNGTYRDYGKVGIGLLDSTFIMIKGNDFSDANADGADLVSSQDVQFVNNSCSLTYSQTLHADCLQMWNKPGDPMTVMRVVADGNNCTGNMQCIDTFGSTDSRPLTDITITNNRAYISTKWAGAINQPNAPCLRCSMHGNIAATHPGMPRSWERPGWYDGKTVAPGNVTGKWHDE